MLQHGQITDAEIYWDDNSLFGIANEVSFPDLEHDYVEHETLGSVGVLKLPKRGLRAMDFSLKMDFPEPDLWTQLHNPTAGRLLQVHQKLDVFGPEGLDREKSTTLVTIVRVMFGKVIDGTTKKGDDTMSEAEGSVTQLTQRLLNSETPIVQIDLWNNIYKVGGEPVWS